MKKIVFAAACLGLASTAPLRAEDGRAFEPVIASELARMNAHIRGELSVGDALDRENVAHTNTWSVLLGLGQVDEVFGKAGKMQIADLPFWRGNRQGRNARLMADQLHRFFSATLNAQGVENAASRLAEALENGRSRGRNLLWLADEIDGLYQFLSEKAASNDDGRFDSRVRAHKTLWTTLLALDQIDEVFSEAGTIPVAKLRFWAGCWSRAAPRADRCAGSPTGSTDSTAFQTRISGGGT